MSISFRIPVPVGFGLRKWDTRNNVRPGKSEHLLSHICGLFDEALPHLAGGVFLMEIPWDIRVGYRVNKRLLKRAPKRTPTVLLVEDEEGDYTLLKAAFRSSPVPIDLRWVQTGEDALAFLRKEAPHLDVPTPDLIVLDLNLPIVRGMDALVEIEADSRLRHLPVVVMTVSNTPSDVYDSYRHCCNSYIVKPLEYDDFAAVVRAMCEYWFLCAKLPTLM